MTRQTRLLLGLLACGTVAAQAAVKGPDAGGYTATDNAVYSFIDMSANNGVSVLKGSDDGMVALTLPFAFRFYNQPYTLACVSANGALYFVAAASSCNGFSDFANTDLSSTIVPGDLPAILPYWSDLTFDQPGAGAVYYGTVGAAPTRRFVIQWNNAFPQGSPNPVTFQAVLAEGSNEVLFQYKNVALGPANPARNAGQATVGVRNTGAPANQQQIAWSYNVPVVAEESALQFSSAPASVCAKVITASVSIDRHDIVYNPGIQRFMQIVRVTNNSGAALNGPFALVLDGVSTNATLANASGTTSCALPAGRPFIVSDRTSLGPKASVTFQLHFSNPTKAAITYTPVVLAGVDAR
jgi:hypothetical protein